MRSCPYCNALVESPSIPPPSGRLLCPRCGDSFPIQSGDSAPQSPTSSRLDDEVRRHRQARESRQSRSIKGKLLAALGLVIVGAIAWWGLTSLRQEPVNQPAANVETAKAVAPIDMPGLAYLPAGTDSVIALQLRPFLDSLPPSEPRETKAALLRLGIPADLLAGIERMIGLGLDDVDQLVIGFKLAGGSIASQPVVVVHSRTRFSLDEIAKHANATLEKKGKRAYYRTTASQFLDRIYVWAPNDRVLVAALNSASLDGIPDAGHENRAHLSPPLVERATHLLSNDTYCWAIFDSNQWDTLGALILLATKRGDLIDRLGESMSTLQTVTLAVRVESEPILTAWLDLKSERAAGELRSWLRERFEKSEKITITGIGNRVTARLPLNSGTLSGLLKIIPSK